jgi:hypothetical protein
MGRALRDVERKLSKPSGKFKERLSNATRIYIQEKNEKQRLYCIYAPEVE